MCIPCLARWILNHQTTREAPHPASDMHIYHAAWVWAPGRIYVHISNARDCPVWTFIAWFFQNVLAFSFCKQQPATNTSFDVHPPVEVSTLTGPLSRIHLKDFSQIWLLGQALSILNPSDLKHCACIWVPFPRWLKTILFLASVILGHFSKNDISRTLPQERHLEKILQRALLADF